MSIDSVFCWNCDKLIYFLIFYEYIPILYDSNYVTFLKRQTMETVKSVVARCLLVGMGVKEEMNKQSTDNF